MSLKNDIVSDIPTPFFDRVIIKKSALKKGDTIHAGVTNHCRIKGLFHFYADLDSIPLNRIIETLQRYKTLGTLYLALSSPFKWHLSNFGYYSWKEYVETLESIPLVHQEYIFCIESKGYSVLRTGAKNGIVPLLLYKIRGLKVPECEICREDYFRFLKVAERQRRDLNEP